MLSPVHSGWQHRIAWLRELYFSLGMVLGFKHFCVNIIRRIHISSPGRGWIVKTVYLSFIRKEIVYLRNYIKP